jgi:hypothetical protein
VTIAILPRRDDWTRTDITMPAMSVASFLGCRFDRERRMSGESSGANALYGCPDR